MKKENQTNKQINKKAKQKQTNNNKLEYIPLQEPIHIQREKQTQGNYPSKWQSMSMLV